MFPLVRGGSRLVVRETVRIRVYQTLRQNNNIIAIRRYQYTQIRRIIWRNHLIQVRTFSTTRVTAWFGDWLRQWRVPQIPQIPQQPAQQPTGGGQQRDPRHLTVDELVTMMGNAQSYLTHGTSNPAVGTLQAPLIGFEDPQARRTNPVAPVGVYAFRGIIAAYDVRYGPWYIVMHASMGNWIQQGAHWYRPGTEAIPDAWIAGYCTDEDMEAAKQKRRSQ